MIFKRLETYIIYRLASSLLIIGYFFLAIIIFDFEMPTWALVVISLFNDLSVMATSFDKVSRIFLFSVTISPVSISTIVDHVVLHYKTVSCVAVFIYIQCLDSIIRSARHLAII